MSWFLKYYRHDECDTSWTDEWSCACNDHCPKCDEEIEPYNWADLSVVLSQEIDRNGWIVSVSAVDAEHDPEYEESHFEKRQEAEDFARQETERLDRLWEIATAQ
jgi:hypothetical protein